MAALTSTIVAQQQQQIDRLHSDQHYDHLQHQDDCFVDASDVMLEQCHQEPGARPLAGPLEVRAPASGAEELDASLAGTAHILRLALSNEFVRALDMCQERASSDLYAGLAHATLSFLRAGLTLERHDLEAAQASVLQSIEVSSRARRQVSTAASVLTRFLGGGGAAYESYSDQQIHAELVNAESLLMHTLISFLADQSVMCLVRGAFRIRACHQRYKECLQVLETRQCWASEEARRHFESGVRMGDGIFNLLMSYLPRRVLRFLEYVGFSGSRSRGLAELEKSIALGDGLRSVLSALVILTYHSYVESLFGLGLYDESKVRQLNKTFLSAYPNSAFFLLFQGRHSQMVGDLEGALDSFQRCIDAQSDWRQFHSICHWEMMWCHTVRMDWSQAAGYAHLLRQHSKWSPASYAYQEATFLLANLLQEEEVEKSCAIDNSEQKWRQIMELMEMVPSLRIRYAGKTIPADKFAIERSVRYCKRFGRSQAGRHHALHALEFLYIWNIFCILKNNPQQVAKLLEFIEKERAKLEHRAGQTSGEQDDEADNCLQEELCLVHLLVGMCQKHLGRLEEADSSFRQTIELGHKHLMQSQGKFLVAHASMELALLELQLGHLEEARELIKTTRANYSGYLLETIVHFRLHAASRQIRLACASNQQSSFDESAG